MPCGVGTAAPSGFALLLAASGDTASPSPRRRALLSGFRWCTTCTCPAPCVRLCPPTPTWAQAAAACDIACMPCDALLGRASVYRRHDTLEPRASGAAKTLGRTWRYDTRCRGGRMRAVVKRGTADAGTHGGFAACDCMRRPAASSGPSVNRQTERGAAEAHSGGAAMQTKNGVAGCSGSGRRRRAAVATAAGAHYRLLISRRDAGWRGD